jgi:hypothetical protein
VIPGIKRIVFYAESLMVLGVVAPHQNGVISFGKRARFCKTPEDAVAQFSRALDRDQKDKSFLRNPRTLSVLVTGSDLRRRSRLFARSRSERRPRFARPQRRLLDAHDSPPPFWLCSVVETNTTVVTEHRSGQSPTTDKMVSSNQDSKFFIGLGAATDKVSWRRSDRPPPETPR